MRNLPELPKITPAGLEPLRSLTAASAKALPGMPAGDLPVSQFTNARQLEAEQMAAEMRYVYDISRNQAKHSRAKAKAESYQKQKAAERSNKIVNRFARR